MHNLLDFALRYAAEGRYVFPLHSPQVSGCCSCGKPLGRGQGQCQAKHPRIPRWQEDATTYAEVVRTWWGRWPDAGIGVVMGKSGIFAIDLDVTEGKRGPDAWGALQDRFGDEGTPVELTTGSGGKHLLYGYEPGIRNTTLGVGIDVRGAGGYIVAPPSLHHSGRRYEGTIPPKVGQAPSWLVQLLKREVLVDAPPVVMDGAHLLTRADLALFIQEKEPYLPQDKTTPSGRVVDAARNIYDGLVWSPHGTRHTTMVTLLGMLRSWVWQRYRAPVDHESVAALMKKSLEQVAALPETQVPTTREWLLDLLARLSANDSAYQGKLEKKREMPDGDRLVLDDTICPDPRNLILGTPAGYFLKKGDGKETTYVGPLMREFVVNAARDLLPVPTTTEEGKELSLSALMRQYGRTPLHTKYSYVVARSCFYEETSAFVQRAGVPKTWKPEFNQHIATWLKLFGGDKHEVLLDWLATLHDLSKPTAALALLGLSGAGKDLFIDGVSAIWGGRRTEFHRAIGTFNASLLDSPIVVGNEGLRTPSKYEGGSVMDALKEMVSGTSRDVEAKYARAVPLEGAVRVIIATNNTGSFHLDKQPNESDLAALNDRVLFIRPTGEARPFLEALGGREATEAWVAGGGLPRHIEWLRRGRQVARGKRFLIQGCGGMADILASQGEAKRVLRALLKVLLALGGEEAVCCMRSGEVWASQVNVKKTWAAYGTKDVPEDLGDAFKAITEVGSGKAVKVHGEVVKMRRVKLTVLRSIAMEEGVEDEFEALLQKAKDG